MYSSNAQPTGTNRPRACPTPTMHTKKACHQHGGQTRNKEPTLASTTQHQTPVQLKTPQLNPDTTWVTRVTAAIATGKHPDPSRTRKLSLPAPMVLPPRGGGRVGRRRTSTPERATSNGGPFVISSSAREPGLRPQAAFAHPLSTSSSRGAGDRRWPAPAWVRGGDGHEGRQGV